MRQLILEATCPTSSSYRAEFDLFQFNDTGRKAALGGYNAIENLMTPSTMAHFGDDFNNNTFEKPIVDYVLGAFSPAGTQGNTDFGNSFGWDSGPHFTSAVNGYNLKYGGSNKYYALKKYAPSTGLNKYYPDSGILSKLN
jgi:hypothetical protein